MKTTNLILILIFLIIFSGLSYSQGVPQLIFYQGNLADANGNAIHESQNINFSIWNSITDGEKLWEEDHTAVPFNQGLFSLMLGSVNPLSTDIFKSPCYLEITIAGETLSPRQQIASVPFAQIAASVAGKSNVFPSDGKVGIGITNPNTKLEVADIVRISGATWPNAGKGVELAYKPSSHIGLIQVYNRDQNSWGNLYLGNGNVGIGTENPISKLQVNGMIQSTSGGFRFPDGTVQSTAVIGSGGIGDNLGNHTATQNISLGGNWLSGDGGDEGVYLTNDGKVGIGTTNPLSMLSVGGDGYAGYAIYGITGFETGAGVMGSANNTGNVQNYGGAFQAYGSEGRGVLGIARHSTGINYGGYFESWSEKGYGVFSIATSSHDQTNYGGYFQAKGKTGYGVYGISSGSDGYGVFGKTEGAVGGRGVHGEAEGTSGIGVYGNATATNAENYGGYFVSKGYNGHGVYSIGKIGVQGFSSYEFGIGIFGKASNTNTDVCGVFGEATGRRGKGVKGEGGEYDFYAQGAGTNYGSSSSIRWKRNIELIDNPIEKISGLRGVYFDWDEEHGGQHDIGMIAEEVGEVLPEIVGYEENGVDATGMDYSMLTPLLVEAVKELSKQVNELKEELKQLKNR